MAAPGFGFSFGDILSAIKILNDVRKTLRDAGGARDKFSNVQTELQQLEILLVHLHEGHWDHGGNAGFLNAIKGMASACELPLQDFLAKIEKYKTLQTKELGIRNRLNRQAKKVHWAINMDEEVQKFRAVMAGKLTSIQLLISTYIIATTTQIDARSQAILHKSLESGRKIQQCQDQFRELHDIMQRNTTDLGTLIRGDDRLVRICVGIKVGVEDFRRLSQAKQAETHRRLKQLQRDQHRGFALIISQIRIHTSRVGGLTELVSGLVRRFGGFTSTAAEFFKQSLNNDLKLFALLRDVHRIIQRQPLSSEENLFQFTDGLGRTRLLPYDLFRNFDMVDLMLKNEFREKPGEWRVIQGQYHLLKDSRTKDFIIDKGEWERSVFPGSHIIMSMIIDGLLFEEGLCPRPACRSRNLPPFNGSTLIICSTCSLEYHYEKALEVHPQVHTNRQNRKGPSRTLWQAGGHNMHRTEGLRPPGARDEETSSPNLSEIAADGVLLAEELEAFRAIHIQTRPELAASSTTDDDGDIVDMGLRSPPSPESRIGIFLERYLELESILWIGHFGVVYVAFDHLTQTWYAVKALSKTNASGEPLDKRQREFQSREIRLHYMASAHPNIVNVHKIAEDPECTYVVADFYPSGDLFFCITERGMYIGNDDLIRQTFLQILNAVEHCHRLGIYHRDLKPENILVSNEGNQNRAFLAGFGLATTTPVSEDQFCGSSFYMSPENLKGMFYRCAPNDVWSLGVILVNLISGRNPWKQASLEDSKYRAYLRCPSFLQTSLSISDEAMYILSKVFDPDPATRIHVLQLKQLVYHCSVFASPAQVSDMTSAEVK